jgi:putative transposase
MAKRKRTVKPLPTIWQVPDELWAIIQLILAALDPLAKTGRPRTGQREALNGILYILRSGSQWNQLPRYFGDDSSVHRTMQRWLAKGVFQRIWAVLIESCQELGGVNWQWQSADCSMGKARFGGDLVGPNPTDRAKPGTKRSIIVEADGGPLGVAAAGANVHDTKLLEKTIDAIVVERPEPTQQDPQHLCVDKAYDNPTGHAAAEQANYIPHIRRIGQEKKNLKGHKRKKARRWVVERTLG